MPAAVGSRAGSTRDENRQASFHGGRGNVDAEAEARALGSSQGVIPCLGPAGPPVRGEGRLFHVLPPTGSHGQQRASN
jgi:hypothetical protein